MEFSGGGLNVPLRSSLSVFAESTMGTKRKYGRRKMGNQVRQGGSGRRPVAGEKWDRGQREGFREPLRVTPSIVGGRKESEPIASPPEFAVVVVIEGLLIVFA